MHNENDLKSFDKMGINRPSRDKHGEDSWENPMSDKLLPGNPRNWRMQGNKLICDTDFGELVKFMPTDVILMGTDDNNRPILKNIYKSK